MNAQNPHACLMDVLERLPTEPVIRDLIAASPEACSRPGHVRLDSAGAASNGHPTCWQQLSSHRGLRHAFDYRCGKLPSPYSPANRRAKWSTIARTRVGTWWPLGMTALIGTASPS